MSRRVPVKTALVGLLVAPAAVAQQPPDQSVPPEPATPTENKPAEPTGAPATMQPVTVTGSRPSEDFQVTRTSINRLGGDLMDVPQSVVVINKALMQSQGATSLSSAIRNVPGITIGAAEGGQIGNNFTFDVGYLMVQAHRLVLGNGLNTSCPVGTSKPGNPQPPPPPAGPPGPPFNSSIGAQGWLNPDGTISACAGTPQLLAGKPYFSGNEFSNGGFLDYNNSVVNAIYHGFTLQAIERVGKYFSLNANYTFSHIIHGIGFYFLLWLVARRLPVSVHLVIAVLLEATWEVFENTPFVINRYRAATISLDYFGDSIVNSMSDIGAMMLGFWIARRSPVWFSLGLVIVLEVLVAAIIRDNLTLNILMLIHPFETIKRWQLGG